MKNQSQVRPLPSALGRRTRMLSQITKKASPSESTAGQAARDRAANVLEKGD
jgi:hypothetical protein